MMKGKTNAALRRNHNPKHSSVSQGHFVSVPCWRFELRGINSPLSLTKAPHKLTMN